MPRLPLTPASRRERVAPVGARSLKLFGAKVAGFGISRVLGGPGGIGVRGVLRHVKALED
jgi:hypothetical protein